MLFAPRIFKAMMDEAKTTTPADLMPALLSLGKVVGVLVMLSQVTAACTRITTPSSPDHHPITRSPDHPITRSPDHPVTSTVTFT